jgi:hypothetical protein
MDATDGGYGVSVSECMAPPLLDMDSHNAGTSQLPLAGAILCCTSIAPEQRVCLTVPPYPACRSC